MDIKSGTSSQHARAGMGGNDPLMNTGSETTSLRDSIQQAHMVFNKTIQATPDELIFNQVVVGQSYH